MLVWPAAKRAFEPHLEGHVPRHGDAEGARLGDDPPVGGRRHVVVHLDEVVPGRVLLPHRAGAVDAVVDHRAPRSVDDGGEFRRRQSFDDGPRGVDVRSGEFTALDAVAEVERMRPARQDADARDSGGQEPPERPLLTEVDVHVVESRDEEEATTVDPGGADRERPMSADGRTASTRRPPMRTVMPLSTRSPSIGMTETSSTARVAGPGVGPSPA